MAKPRQPLTPLQKLDKIDATLSDRMPSSKLLPEEREKVRAARRILRGHSWAPGTSLRGRILRELAAAYSRGYAEKHEDQMRMRILDRKECEAKHESGHGHWPGGEAE